MRLSPLAIWLKGIPKCIHAKIAQFSAPKATGYEVVSRRAIPRPTRLANSSVKSLPEHLRRATLSPVSSWRALATLSAIRVTSRKGILGTLAVRTDAMRGVTAVSISVSDLFSMAEPSKCQKYPALESRKLHSTRGRSNLLFLCC